MEISVFVFCVFKRLHCCSQIIEKGFFNICLNNIDNSTQSVFSLSNANVHNS